MTLFTPVNIYNFVIESFGDFACPENSIMFTLNYFQKGFQSGSFLGDENNGEITSILYLEHCQGDPRKMFNDPLHPYLNTKEEFFLLVALSVKPQYRGQGFGTALIQRAEQHVREKHPSIQELRAIVSPQISPASHHIFQKLGYKAYYEVSVPAWKTCTFFRKQLDTHC